MTAELNYHHLRYFRAVAHLGNLTEAARQQHVSQSAISVQIKKLEQQIGHALFERTGRRLVLTEAGRIALDHADAIFTLGEELLGTLGEGGATARRELRIGALGTLSRNFQTGFIQPLIGREDVKLTLRSGRLGDLMELLVSHRLEVVLSNTLPRREEDATWVPHPIATQPVNVVGRPASGPPPGDLAELLTSQALILPSASSSIRTGFDALVDSLGIRPRVAAEVDDMAMLRLLARDGAGLAIVPTIVVRDELESGALTVLADLPDLRESFYAITASRRFPSPLLAELIPQP